MGREALRQKHPDLADFAEEINPFTSDTFMNLVTIIDDDDLKAIGQYSEKTLLERYHENLEHVKTAQPPLTSDAPSILLRKSDQLKKRKIPANVSAAKNQREAEQAEIDRVNKEKAEEEEAQRRAEEDAAR